MLDELKQIERDWCDCTRCDLGERAFKHVLHDYTSASPRSHMRQRVHVMMIGEGPGEVENAFGRPFMGPAGRLLRRAVSEALPGTLRILYTNLVACRPQDKVDGKNRKPRDVEIEACRPRLTRTIEITNPHVIVCLGRIPTDYIHDTVADVDMWDGQIQHTFHPAYILRNGGIGTQPYVEYVSWFRHLFSQVRIISGKRIEEIAA